MAEQLNVFAGNPIIPGKRSNLDPQALETLLTADEAVKAGGGARLLPVYDGKPLIVSCRDSEGRVTWSLCWQPLELFGSKFPISLSSSGDSNCSEGPSGIPPEVSSQDEVVRKYDKVVYLGERYEIPYFAIDVTAVSIQSAVAAERQGRGPSAPSPEEDERGRNTKLAQTVAEIFTAGNANQKAAFVDLRTLMMAADWGNKTAMEELAIAGHARALMAWHKQAQYCGRCGSKTLAIEAGQRRQCPKVTCKNKLYPRMDPVVIMLVIDKERDCVVLARQPRFLPRMWSCLAGFIEAGESLEEAVRRETREEVGIEVGEIVYHSSQPWPVGPSSMSCQLMVGFLAYAKSFDIQVDKKELEEAQWHSREAVREALTYTDYRKTQEATAFQMHQICLGERSKVDMLATVQTPMYVPGPYAIAHNLIATWASQAPNKAVLGKI